MEVFTALGYAVALGGVMYLLGGMLVRRAG